MTPADELRAAADRLNTLADNAMSGEWQPRLCPTHDFDAAFIAAMSPDLARAIATLLRAQADEADRERTILPGEFDPALAVARATPGETP